MCDRRVFSSREMMMINHLYHHRTAAFWRIRYNTLTTKHYFLLPQLLLHVYTRVLLSSSITGALFWATTFYCWYKVIGYFFVPLGIYFTSLVSPAFVRRSKKNGARETVIAQTTTYDATKGERIWASEKRKRKIRFQN